jgi:hypothetical protein
MGASRYAQTCRGCAGKAAGQVSLSLVYEKDVMGFMGLDERSGIGRCGQSCRPSEPGAVGELG